uniref:Uncharacterized protein n=1 Tax=Medicago truncatula TaxID=3880 RepID=I3SPE4_MEDTR|nr:unknown [Medicago truncatula]
MEGHFGSVVVSFLSPIFLFLPTLSSSLRGVYTSSICFRRSLNRFRIYLSSISDFLL